jgi:hypothetical protein
MIMGFLTYLYGPTMTNFDGELQGAKVPFPLIPKIKIDSKNKMSPIPKKPNPMNFKII